MLQQADIIGEYILHIVYTLSLVSLHSSFAFRNVQVLVEKDNNCLFSEDKDGLTPLHIACQNGDTQVVKILLDSGANIDHKDVQGYTPLNIAIRKSYKETVKLLLSK